MRCVALHYIYIYNQERKKERETCLAQPVDARAPRESVTLERGARPRGKTIKRREAKKREGEDEKRQNR